MFIPTDQSNKLIPQPLLQSPGLHLREEDIVGCDCANCQKSSENIRSCAEEQTSEHSYDRRHCDKKAEREILHNEVNVTKVGVELVPKIFTQEYKDNQNNICSDIMEGITKEPTCSQISSHKFSHKTKKKVTIDSVKYHYIYKNKNNRSERQN